MSVHSDDTDVLLLFPPDLFLVSEEFPEPSSSPNVVESTPPGDSYYEMSHLRRYGSADILNSPSRSSVRSKSHHGTPIKFTNSPTKYNILSTESYLMQKHRDEQNLREIKDYFSKKENGHGDEDSSPVPKLDLPQLHDMLCQIDETERDMSEKSDEPSIASVRKALNFDSPAKAVNGVSDQYKHPLTIRTDNSELSLQGLWSNQTGRVGIHEEVKVLRQRVEEERLRRQHCEDMIRELQKRLLESQEKMAVALNVDNEKDAAIKKLKDSWTKIVEQWKDSESKKSDISAKLKEMEEKFSAERERLAGEAKKYEQELLKSLDLVHDYKEQQISAVKNYEAAMAELEEVQMQFKIKEDECEDKTQRLEELTERLKNTEAKSSELAHSVNELGRQLKHCQLERDRLSLERDAKLSLQKKVDEYVMRESQLHEQLKNAAKTKNELKQYYQEQVENIVSGKQRDFQTQLENAEKKLLKQFETKEKELAEIAAHDRQFVIESHKSEVAILEQTHHETVECYKLELSMCKKKVDDMLSLFSREKTRQRDLTENLHNIFQNQWKETLRAIAPFQDVTNDLPMNNGILPVKRQGTFTKDSDEVPDVRPAVGVVGSGTYRINETPQKIPNPQKSLQQHMEQDCSHSSKENRRKSDKEKSAWK